MQMELLLLLGALQTMGALLLPQLLPRRPHRLRLPNKRIDK